MIALYSLIVALFIVSGQALWKAALNSANSSGYDITTVHGFLKVLISWPLFFGVILYGIATVAYILLLGKYKYFQVQSIVVGGSLVLTLMVSMLVFKDHATPVNIIGVGAILVGALLVVR